MSYSKRLMKFMNPDAEKEEERRKRMEELDKKRYVRLDKNQINAKKVTTDPDADDYHLFEVNEDDTSIKKSCCGLFTLKRAEQEFIDYATAFAAPEMRVKSLEKKREMCGRCVASLYGNTDTKKKRQN